MAQTKRKRRSKHRGTPVGTVESRGRTGRKPDATEKKPTSKELRAQRWDKPPTWKSSAGRAIVPMLALFAALLFLLKEPLGTAVAVGVFSLLLYIPLGYFTDLFLYQRRQRKKLEEGGGKRS